MAWRLQEYVTRGEIDNRIRGRVMGRIWLAGVEDPLILHLEGNCQPDLAGCLLTFENHAPIPLSAPPPSSLQRGRAGDMTASRKLRIPDITIDEFIRRTKEGLPAPERLANCLYLEWFSEFSGRMVIESTDFTLKISTPEWRLSPEERVEPTNEDSVKFLESASDEPSEPGKSDSEDHAPWDEFRHEQALRKRDALTDKFGKLFDKYRNHPNRDQIIAREMGWDWLEENQEEDDDSEEDEPDPSSEVDAGDWVKPEPDPAREGVDWIRTPDGEIRHPLYDRAFHLTSGLHDYCRENGLLEDTDSALEELSSQTGLLAAKLAGALTDLADGTNLYEPGFVVALLKRALDILNHALAALDVVTRKSLLPLAKSAAYRNELLSIREGMLALVQEFRRRIS